MSNQLGRVVSEILHRYFGEIVQKVGNDLFEFGSKPIALIVKSTGLPRAQVVESLRTLLKFDLVTFESVNNVIADYKLNYDNVLLLIRYPRYLLQIKSKFGSVAEVLTEELLQHATCTATILIVSIATKYKDDKEKNMTIVKLKDTFISLATAGYIQQAPVAEMKEGSEVPTLIPVATIVPDLNANLLMQVMNSGNIQDAKDNVYWKINFDRFHQDFRDDLMIKAVTRRIDENAGELMRHMLLQMYLSSPAWAADSNPLLAIDIKEAVLRTNADKLLGQYFDQYLKVLEESCAGMVCGRGAAGAAGAAGAVGQYSVRVRRGARLLAGAAVEQLLLQRAGHHALRIWRVIHEKKFIEEDDIQKHAMLPNKECKELTYKLMDQHFISVQPMRKAASAGGMVKAVYLYHVNFHEVAHTCRELCYRSLHNVIARRSHELGAEQRLVQKAKRVRSIVHGMRQRNEPQENIDDVEETLTPPELAVLQGVEKRLKQLSAAELQLDKTLFIFNWYFMYPHTT